MANAETIQHGAVWNERGGDAEVWFRVFNVLQRRVWLELVPRSSFRV